VEEGIVPGGGVAFIDVLDALNKIEAEGDEKTGVQIIIRALEEPVRQIANNAGLEGSVVFEKVKSLGKGFGFNAAAEKYENMIDAGIVDPAKFTRSTLQNAASIASMVLTTEALVTDIPEEKKNGAAAGMPPM